jgi:tetratricopeptide (TPR) repeat protein
MLKQLMVGTLFLPILAFFLTGCGEDAYYEDEAYYEDYAEPEVRDNSLVQAARLLGDLKSLASQRSPDFRQMQETAWEIESLAPDSEETRSAKALVERARGEYDKAAGTAYKGTLDNVMDLADKELYADAIRHLERFIESYPGSESAGKAQKAKANLSRAINARNAYDRFVNRLTIHSEVGDYSQALEYLKTQQPQGLEGTPYESKLHEFITRFKLEAEMYDDRLAKEKALPWEDLSNYSMRSWDYNGGTWDSGSGLIRGSNDSPRRALLMVRQGDWKDYIIDMQFTFGGNGFNLLIRGILGEQTEYQRIRGIRPPRFYRGFEVCSGLKNPSGTIDMKMTVRRDMVTIESPSLDEPRHVKIAKEYSYGPIAIELNGNSQVNFTRFRVKHLSKVSAPTAQKDK